MLVTDHTRAIAHVPAAVSDEWVAVALELRDGATFDPGAFYERFLRHQQGGGLDPKWMPDFVRIVESRPLSRSKRWRLVEVLERAE